MPNDAWRCNNDEHFNKKTDTECEICGEKRPSVKNVKYVQTDKFGKLKIIWEFENTESGYLLKKEQEIVVDSIKGELEIENFTNNEEINITAINKIATYSETIKIILSKPEILFFKSDIDKVLENSTFNLSWEVSNAESVLISNIGKVEAKGKIEKLTVKHPYKIIAENDIGKEERQLILTVLPLPKIKEFRSKQQKIEFGKETKLFWEIENAVKAELHWMGNMEIIPNKGEKTVSPSEHTNYKLILTALDSFTKEEKELTVQVFKRVEIKSFVSDLEFVIDTLPIKLSWEIENASNIILSSNMQADIDVTGKTEIEITPRKTSIFNLRANNELFTSNSSQLKIEVQSIPTFNPDIIPRLPSGTDLMPTFELNFKELTEKILSESQVGFKSTMKPTKKFSLIKSLQKILNK